MQNFSHERELAYWLEIKCLRELSMPIAQNIREALEKEFPRSNLLGDNLWKS